MLDEVFKALTPMKIKTKIELLRAMRRRRKASQAGFTLVEVLVVAGILAILFASLVPNLLAARARAGAAAVISEVVGISRACQGVQSSGVGTTTVFGYSGTVANTKQPAVICSGVAPIQVTLKSRVFGGPIVTPDDNIQCLGTPISATAAQSKNFVSVETSTDGNLTCTLTNG